MDDLSARGTDFSILSKYTSPSRVNESITYLRLVRLGSATGGQGTFGPVTYTGNGQYTATFTGALAGSNTATMDGARITSTPAAITVTPGPYSLAKSVVTVSPPPSVAVGKTINVFLQPRMLLEMT
jgi:hypothetical protein